MRRRRFGGGGGSGRKRRGNLSGRGSRGDSGEGAVMGGGDDEDEDDGGDGDEDDGDDEDEAPRRGSSRRRSGRRSSADDDDDRSDRQRMAAEAEKKQQQTILMIGIPLGILFLLVLVFALSGESKHETDDDVEKGPAAIKRVDVDVNDVRRLVSDAKANMRDSMAVEGEARVARLDAAKRAINQARELIERKRSSVPNPAARGPSFEQLDLSEQELNQTFVMVRKALLEEGQ